MPYYLYKMSSPTASALVKKLELLDQFDNFREAKNSAKQLRVESDSDESVFKVIFADNQLQAEELLMEKRDKPVLMEYER
jgi:hypothetical protein